MADSGPLPPKIRNMVIGENPVSDDQITAIINGLLNQANEFPERGDSAPSEMHLHLEKGPNKKIIKPRPHIRKTLSYTERRLLGLYSIGKSSLKYEDLIPLHSLWQNYMRKYIDLQGFHDRETSTVNEYLQSIAFKLYRADYHGAELEVIRSTCPLYVGKKGFVAMETKNCFALVGKDNITRKLPKSQCQFSFTIDDIQFTFFGKNLISRPADRSSKKIKTIYLPIL